MMTERQKGQALIESHDKYLQQHDEQYKAKINDAGKEIEQKIEKEIGLILRQKAEIAAFLQQLALPAGSAELQNLNTMIKKVIGVYSRLSKSIISDISNLEFLSRVVIHRICGPHYEDNVLKGTTLYEHSISQKCTLRDQIKDIEKNLLTKFRKRDLDINVELINWLTSLAIPEKAKDDLVQIISEKTSEIQKKQLLLGRDEKQKEARLLVTTPPQSLTAPVAVRSSLTVSVSLFPAPKTRVAVEVPKLYSCPLTGKIMEDPVITPSGNTYENTAITEWVRKNGTDPGTGLKITIEQLYPNRVLKKLIERYEIDELQQNTATPS